MRRFFKFVLVLGLVLAALVVFLVIYENHAGAKAWDRVRQDLEAANVLLDLEDFEPQMPEPGSNFATTPMIAALLDFEMVPTDPNDSFAGSQAVYADETNRQRFLKLALPRTLEGLPDWSKGQRADLLEIATNLSVSRSFTVPEDGLPAERVLAAFAPVAADLAELDEAALRPHAQVPVAFGEDFMENIGMLLPFVTEFLQHQKFQSARVAAALNAGKSDEALRGVRTMRQISRSSGSHPTVIGHLVEVACWQITLSVLWEGLASGAWSDQQLAELQSLLQSEDLLARAERAMNCELVTFQIDGADFMKSADSKAARQVGAGVSHESMLGAAVLVPDGVWDHNKALGAQLMLDYQILPLRRREFGGLPDMGEILGKTTPRNFFVKTTLPSLETMTLRSAEAQQSLDLAATACALERFKLQQETYPDTLAALVPDLLSELPADLCRKGSSLLYAKTEQGYALYSVGANRTDDGGRAGFKSAGRQNFEAGDWVWAVPMPSLASE